MSLYIIYHMVGVKVGCTKEFDKRCEQNRALYGDAEIVVLQEIAGDIRAATKAEAKYARQFGYALNTPYDQAIQNQRDRARASVLSAKHNHKDPEHQKRAQAAATAASNIRIGCPHCGLVGQARAMLRWHFENCRKKGTNVSASRVPALSA